MTRARHGIVAESALKLIAGHRRLSRQCGSALTETIVLMLAVIPLMLAIPMLGHLTDVRQQAVTASRYVAWEGTVGTAPAAGVVHGRFFPAGDHGSADAPEPLMKQGMHRVLADGTASQRAPVSSGGAGSRTGERLAAIGEFLDGFSGNEWGLDNEGMGRAEVTVRLRENRHSGPLQGNCASETDCFIETAVVLGDGWSSADDAQARRRVRSLVPTSTLEPVGKVLAAFGALPVARELRDLKHAFGHVDMQVLSEYEE